MKQQIKNLIKEKIKTNEFNLSVYAIVKNHVSKHVDKKYTRRYLSDLTRDLTAAYGSTIFKYQSGASLRNDLSWKEIELNLQVNNDYRYNYQLHYDSQDTITIEEFERLNTCWSKDVEVNKKLEKLLKDDKKINFLTKNIKALNEANKNLCEFMEFGSEQYELKYDLKKFLDIKLNEYPKRKK